MTLRSRTATSRWNTWVARIADRSPRCARSTTTAFSGVCGRWSKPLSGPTPLLLLLTKRWRSRSIPDSFRPSGPVPWREIWVYSPRVEGIHLRGGRLLAAASACRIAATISAPEILGLMKAQLVKNAVIVRPGEGWLLSQTATGQFQPRQLAQKGPTATRCSSAPCSRSPTTSSTTRSLIPIASSIP